MKRDLNEFLKYTKKDGDCLLWTRCANTDGYPRAVVDGNANTKVHRVVYELTQDCLNSGEVVRHTCDNPLCINPDHLLKGSPADNSRDRDTRDRHGASKVTRKQVRMIRELWASGNYLQKELAETFGLNHRTISSLVTGKHWKHVE